MRVLRVVGGLYLILAGCGLAQIIGGNGGSVSDGGTNGGIYRDASGTLHATASGGAGTLCWISTNGGVPVYGSCAGSASTVWSALTNPSAVLGLSMGANTTTLTWGATTGAATNLFTFTDTLNNTGTGALVNSMTASGSALFPLQATARGSANGIQMSVAGLLNPIGTGGINATHLNGTQLSGLSTGLVKVTTATGVPSVAISSDVYALWSGTCNNTTFLRGDGACAAPTGTGTVTSVSFTGGLISVGTPTSTPALTVAGTSGGIPYFSSASTWATSAALTANGVLLGGGAGAAPTVTAADSTTTHALFATAGAPAFRAIVSGDIPTLNQSTSGTAASFTGNLTGDTTSVGMATTTSKINGTSFVGTNGNLVSFGASNAPADAGFLASNVVRKDAVSTLAAVLTAPGGDLFNGGIDGQSGTTYTVVASDENKLLTFKNASPVAVSLPQATTAGFTAGAFFYVANLGAGAVTITPTTSTINGSATVVLNQNQGAYIASDGTNYSAWVSSAPSGSGTVTSVGESFTGGLISVGGSPVTTSGTLALTVAGTSGGIPYFSSASTWATSAALTANAPVIGGGAGVAPTVGTRSGNTTTFVTSTGALTSGHCPQFDASGNVVDSGTTNCGGGAGNPVTLTTVTFSATPTFTRSTQIQEWLITLTGNVTSSTTSGLVAADILVFNICQDGTGSRTFAWPTGFSQAATISPTASICTKQTFYWDGSNAINLTGGVTTDTSLLITGATSTAPATPASGNGTVYIDSTSKNLAVKDDAGVVKHGIQTNTGTSHQFATAVSDAGVITLAQPAFTDISGTAAAAQLPNPTASTLGGVESLVSTAHQWINTISTSGVPSSTQPTFADLAAGTAAAVGTFPGGDLFLGGVNAQSGTTYTVVAADENKLLTFNNASSVAVTLPQATTTGFTSGAFFTVFNRGAGAVTFTPTTSTINGSATVVLNQNQGAYIVSDGTNYSAWVSSAPSGSGTVTSVAESFTGGLVSVGGSPVTTSGTLALTVAGTSGGIVGFTGASTWASSAAWAAGGIGYGLGAGSVPVATAAGTAKQVVLSGGSGAPTMIDFPDVHYYPAANCVSSTAGSAYSLPAASTFTPACRGGTNNLNGTLQAIPSTGATAYFQFQLPSDWDTANQPYLKIYYGSGANTSGTVIWTVSSGCTKSDGSITDDPAFVAESAMGTQTMAVASREWAQSAQFVNLTSGNNCIVGSMVDVKVVLSGTAASAINWANTVITTPRLLTVQAN